MDEKVLLKSRHPEMKRSSSLLKVQKRGLSNSINSPTDHILKLQRTIGNQAVLRLFNTGTIQAKLKVGQPGDIYEQEADRVADAVMSMPEQKVQQQPEEEEEEIQTKLSGNQIAPFVQGQTDEDKIQAMCAPCAEEYNAAAVQKRAVEPSNLCPKCRTERQNSAGEKVNLKPLSGNITPFAQKQPLEEEEEEPIQTKSLPLENYPIVQRQIEEEEEEPVQTKLLSAQITPSVQRQEEEEEEPLMTKGNARVTSVSNKDLSARLSQSRGGGQPLPDADRNFMENRFRADFSGVRVHTDNDAAQMSKELNAVAFTQGKDIYFGAGRYNPDISSGKRLMAHELTHVIQQGNV